MMSSIALLHLPDDDSCTDTAKATIRSLDYILVARDKVIDGEFKLSVAGWNLVKGCLVNLADLHVRAQRRVLMDIRREQFTAGARLLLHHLFLGVDTVGTERC